MAEYGNQWSVQGGSAGTPTGTTRSDMLDSDAPVGEVADVEQQDLILQVVAKIPITPEGISVASDLFGAVLALILVYNQVSE